MRLDYTTDLPTLTAWASLPLPVIDSVVVLVTTRSVCHVTVRAIRQGRTLAPNGFRQHLLHGGVEPQPPIVMDTIAAAAGVDAGHVEDLGCIKVADAGHGSLIQEPNFDGSPAGTQPLLELVCGDTKGIRPQSARPELTVKLGR